MPTVAKRRRRTVVTPEIVSRIRAMSGDGLFNYEIAHVVGLSVSAVQKIQKREGIAHYTRAEARRAWASRQRRLSPRACRIAGCDQPRSAQGLCCLHYDRLRLKRPLHGPARKVSAVLAAIRAGAETSGAIQTALGASRDSVYSALRRLRRAGLIEFARFVPGPSGRFPIAWRIATPHSRASSPSVRSVFAAQ